MRQGDLLVMSHLDLISFLKTVPAVIGIAGLLTFLMRKREPESDKEIVNVVNNVRSTFVILGCTALILLSAWLLFRPPPPDHESPIARLAPTGHQRNPVWMLTRSDGPGLGGFKQAWIVVSPARHIDSFRDGPHAQQTVGRWPQQFDAGLSS
jgi:hypothetical protein